MRDIDSVVAFQERLINTIQAQNQIFTNINGNSIAHAIGVTETIKENMEIHNIRSVYERLNPNFMNSLTDLTNTMQTFRNTIPIEEINEMHRIVNNIKINYTVPSLEPLTQTMIAYSSIMEKVQSQLEILNKLNFDFVEEDDVSITSDHELTIDISEINYNKMILDIEEAQDQIDYIENNNSNIEEAAIKEGLIEKAERNFKLEPGTLKKSLQDFVLEKIYEWLFKVMFSGLKYVLLQLLPILLSLPSFNYMYNVNINININIEQPSEVPTEKTDRHYINKRIDYLGENLFLNEEYNQIRILTKDNYIYKFKKRNTWPITYASKGDLMMMLEKNRNWTKVSYYNEEKNELVEGWVFSRYLEKIPSKMY